MKEREDSLTTIEMQERVHEYISQFKEGYFSPLSMLARVTEEVGELAREINHHYGEKPKKQTEDEKALEEEFGDLLFVMLCFANSLDIDIDESFNHVMEKFEVRDGDRWTKIEEDQHE